LTHDTKQAGEVTETADAANAFVNKAKDLGALRDAVADAASVGLGLWLSYLFVLLYLAIAAGAVTHRDLLLESPVKLPFLNVDLPLAAFFALGPLLLVIVHAYVLLHFSLLAGKVGAFDAELRAQVADDDLRARLRRQLPSNIFVQFLAGPTDVRTGMVGVLLKLIAWISLVLGPLALLVLFQLQFLPYHDEGITLWQRFAVLLDLLLLWRVWPSIVRATTQLTRRDFVSPRFGAAALASIALVLLVFTIATFPGEWLDENLPPLRFIPTEWTAGESQRVQATQAPESGSKWTSLHELLVAGSIDFVARKPMSLWSNRLVLPSIDVIDHAKFDTEAKIAALPETLSLRGRRLEGAVLWSARLSKADLTGARLEGALLSRADLREAKIGCEENGFPLRCIGPAQLTGANLIEAQLQGANLRRAQLQDAELFWARLDGAFMWEVQLQGADLRHAVLEGADMSGAQLQGANFQDASLIGADLSDSSREQANFTHAKLGLADLRGSHCTGPCAKQPILVDKNPILLDDNTVLNDIDGQANFTSDVATYDKALAPFLLDTLAAADQFVLAGIAQRVAYGAQTQKARNRSLYQELSCGLQRRIKEGNVQLDTRVLYLVRILFFLPRCQQWCSDKGLSCGTFFD
jgi:uncharacterized protein YjbI with pentapeptide repeats